MEADNKQLEQVMAAAKAAETACRYWQIGRGKPIDRQSLVDAECVSDTFVDRLTTLAKKHSGDAEKLLKILADGDVKRWQSRNTDRLRTYFEENGYLSSDSCLAPEDIRLRTLAIVANEVKNGTLEQAWINRLVAQLPT